ncbi:MAG: hypothetical protein H6719_15770 [Sandaracinaceae bacterium]|nr:hypothetical protein [Sandaracinaceae bacterium]
MTATLRSLACVIALSACGPAEAEPASPPPATAVDDLDPACRDALANVPSPVVLPDGVARDARDREQILEAAPSWRLASGVSFALEPATVADGRVVLRGVLHNGTDSPQTVMLSEAGAGFFTATLTDPTLTRRPPPEPEPGVTPPPALFPEPRAFTLAPGARWPLETAVVLSCWEPAPGRAVTAHWWLHVEGSGLDGEARVTLP